MSESFHDSVAGSIRGLLDNQYHGPQRKFIHCIQECARVMKPGAVIEVRYYFMF